MLQAAGLLPEVASTRMGPDLKQMGTTHMPSLLLQVTDLPPEVAITRMGSNLEQAGHPNASHIPVSAPGSLSSDLLHSSPSPVSWISLQSLSSLLDLTQVTAALQSPSSLLDLS